MMRSGSTWSFNVVRLILERHGELDGTLPRWVGALAEVDRFIEAQRSNPKQVLVKVHRPGPFTRDLIASGEARNLFTHRDPRDAIASMQEMWGWQLCDMIRHLRIISEMVDGYRKSGHTLLLPYADIVARPGETIVAIASYLGVALDATEVEAIDAQTNRKAARALSDAPDFAVAPGTEHEETTLLHKNHIRDGRVGRFKDHLSAGDAATIARELAPLMEALGYA
jgi:hypothetical protein